MTLERQITELTNATTELTELVRGQMATVMAENESMKRFLPFDFIVSSSIPKGPRVDKNFEKIQEKINEYRTSTSSNKNIRVFIDDCKSQSGTIEILVSHVTLEFRDDVVFNLEKGWRAISIGNHSNPAIGVFIKGGHFKYPGYDQENTPIHLKSGSCVVRGVTYENANADPEKANLDYINDLVYLEG